jgi:hypothetical protein
VNKLRTAGLAINKKQKHKRQEFTEEKLDDTGARLELALRKSSSRDWSVKVWCKNGNTIAEAKTL